MSISSTGLSDWEFGPLAVSPKTAGHMLACGLTKIYELIDSQELESYLDGRSRRITTRSIKAHIERHLALASQAETRASQAEAHNRTDHATAASLASRHKAQARATAKAAARATAESVRPQREPPRVQKRTGARGSTA